MLPSLAGDGLRPRMMSAKTITTSLSRHARAMPDRIAVVCDGHSVTWSNLDQAVNRLAAHLTNTVPAGCGIALHLPNGPALVLFFLAAAKAGREAQILDPSWPLPTAISVLVELSPKMAISGDRALAGGFECLTVIDPYVSFAGVADAVDADPCFVAVDEPDPGTPFYVGFTSGSTGKSKGYRRHHRSWFESFRAGDREFNIGTNDVVLAPGSLTHSLFLYGLAHGLYAGATVVLCRQFKPSYANRLAQAYKVSVIYGVPTQLEMMIEAAEREDERPLETMRWVLSSGAKWQSGWTARLRKMYPRARFAEFYGASELSFVTVARGDEDVPPGSVGRAFSGVTLTIRDQLGKCLPTGEAGHVFVESPFLFTGYACGGDDALIRHGEAVSVGDIGVLDARGFLRLVGRGSRMIITAGKNVYPEEIEKVLERHPAVAAAAVLGVEDERRGQRLVALLNLRGDPGLESSDLIGHARASLPLYKIPRRFCVPPQWPTTSSGKTDFNALHRIWISGACEALP